jgi:hypothetical protein
MRKDPRKKVNSYTQQELDALANDSDEEYCTKKRAPNKRKAVIDADDAARDSAE